METGENKPTYDELLLKVENLEKSLIFSQEKYKYTIGQRIPTCQICFEPVECPVTFNTCDGFKCHASQSNPSCLLCVRSLLDNMKKQSKNEFTCLWKCCTLKNKGYLTYGEIGRKADDVAEPTMYRMMGSEGITQCRRCNIDCVTVYNLAMHIKKECQRRRVSCNICKKMMEAKELPEHEKTCFYKCKYCHEKLPSVSKDETIHHYCKKKPIFTCKYCLYTFCIETLIEYYNNGTYHKCSKLYKNESVPSTTSNQVPLTITDYMCSNNNSLPARYEHLTETQRDSVFYAFSS
uniref:TRAF-type domain-containing protein n=1 Tax=viral metagenome TaxID=1070528 RepID=A0A6C0BU08_9ZZZZ